jgi:hypothetical protein
MRIEILVGNDDPVVYPLNAPKITVGSSENCEIILNADGVSRKHLTILSEGDSYFVIDQGSSNGSYINEERLIPGRKVEFTSFFPVRLSDNVLISLLSDEEVIEDAPIELPTSFKPPSEKSAPPQKNEEKTTVISLRDLSGPKTEKLTQVRDAKRGNSKKSKPVIDPPKAKKKKNYAPYFYVLIFVLVAGYNIFKRRSEVAKESQKAAQVNIPQEAVPKPPPPSPYLVPKEELTAKHLYSEMAKELKCTTDIENLFCNFFPDAKGEGLGVIQVGLKINVFVDGTSYFEEAKKYVALPVGDSSAVVEEYNKLIGDTAVYLYMIKITKLEPIHPTKVQDFKFSIVFFKKDSENFTVDRVVAFLSPALRDLNQFVFEQNLFQILANGQSALNLTKNIYTIY